MADTNIIIIIVAFVVAIGAIYILYSIILFQGGSGKKGDELQLSTKIFWIRSRFFLIKRICSCAAACNKIP